MTTFSVESVGAQIGLGSTDARGTIISMANTVTGLLTLVSLFMLTIAGFRWLTSGSKEEFKDQAKRLIISTIIGEILVLLAWAIVRTILRGPW